MGQMFKELSPVHIQFIAEQKIFFVATATAESHINISPKGMDSLLVPDKNHVAWLNTTGSGNETSAHVQKDPRMTLMFCSFDEQPLILRIYGTARVFHNGDPEWKRLLPLFKPLPGTRQIFSLTLDLVQTSCGKAVPYYNYAGEREMLNEWAAKKGDEGLRQYWRERNAESIDGIPTNIASRNI